MPESQNREFKQMLLCGLDFSGKTTLIKKYASDLENYEATHSSALAKDKNQANPNANTEFFSTTPYLNIEKIALPESSMPCIVYDISGQVSLLRNALIQSISGKVQGQLVILLPRRRWNSVRYRRERPGQTASGTRSPGTNGPAPRPCQPQHTILNFG